MTQTHGHRQSDTDPDTGAGTRKRTRTQTQTQRQRDTKTRHRRRHREGDAQIHTLEHAHTNIHTHQHIHTHTLKHMYKHTHAYTHKRTHTHTHIHTHTHTHTHTRHTRTRTHAHAHAHQCTYTYKKWYPGLNLACSKSGTSKLQKLPRVAAVDFVAVVDLVNTWSTTEGRCCWLGDQVLTKWECLMWCWSCMSCIRICRCWLTGGLNECLWCDNSLLLGVLHPHCLRMPALRVVTRLWTWQCPCNCASGGRNFCPDCRMAGANWRRGQRRRALQGLQGESLNWWARWVAADRLLPLFEKL